MTARLRYVASDAIDKKKVRRQGERLSKRPFVLERKQSSIEAGFISILSVRVCVSVVLVCLFFLLFFLNLHSLYLLYDLMYPFFIWEIERPA